MSTNDGVKELGRSLAQLHVKLGAVQGTLDRMEGSAALAIPAGAAEPTGSKGREPDEAALHVLLDLVDAVDRAQEARSRMARGPARVGWFRRKPPAAADEGALWDGLRLAGAAAHESLERMGVRAAPEEGEPDPQLHRVIEVLGDSGNRNTIERTVRRGWTIQDRVLRTAQVVVRRQ